MKRKTLIIGASTKPERYSYKALNKLHENGYEILAIGSKKGVVNGWEIANERIHDDLVHTITLYINSSIQSDYISYFIKLKPNRIIFNPGTENPLIYDKLRSNNIEVVEACTLVMLASNTY